jgi:RNA polymerase sigma-70 factor (ECF subfamily)
LSPSPIPSNAESTAGTGDRPGGRIGELFQSHSEAIYRAAFRVTGNAADAEDVLQTVFLRLSRRGADELREDAGGYLHRSAVNAALDIVRSRNRAGWVPLEASAPSGGSSERPELASDAPDPERESRSRQLRAHLRLALSRLSPRAAEAFALRYFEGMGNLEIADHLGISQGVVAVLLHRTRARLKKELVALEGVAS